MYTPYWILQRYQHQIRHHTKLLSCRYCSRPFEARALQYHFFDEHGSFLPNHSCCPWCEGRVSWRVGEKAYYVPHLSLCFKRYIRQFPWRGPPFVARRPFLHGNARVKRPGSVGLQSEVRKQTAAEFRLTQLMGRVRVEHDVRWKQLQKEWTQWKQAWEAQSREWDKVRQESSAGPASENRHTSSVKEDRLEKELRDQKAEYKRRLRDQQAESDRLFEKQKAEYEGRLLDQKTEYENRLGLRVTRGQRNRSSKKQKRIDERDETE